MPLEDILLAMESEAAEERGRILAAARAEAEKILSDARAEIESDRQRRLDLERQLLRVEQARDESEARLAGLRQLAEARERLVELAFDQASAELIRLRDSPNYPAVLGCLLAEAAAEIGAGPLVLQVDPRDAERLREIARSSGLTAVVDPTIHSAGGLIASDPDGRVVVRNTFEARLSKARETLRAAVVAAIEPEPRPPDPAGGV